MLFCQKWQLTGKEPSFRDARTESKNCFAVFISSILYSRLFQIYMEMTLSNKAMQPLTNFAIQFNKNSFGLIPAVALNIPAPIAPNGSTDISLPLNTAGPVMKMDPLTNLQVGRLGIRT